MSRVVNAALKSSPSILGAYFSWILANSRNPRKSPISIKSKKLKNVISVINKNLKVDLRVTGLENTQNDKYGMITPNHLSNYDPLAVISALKDPVTFLSKKENKKLPFVGRAVSAIEGLFLDRNDLKESLSVMQTIEADLLEQNKNWIVFPEGTRQKDSEAPLLEFHSGAYRTAMKAKVPIIPTALYGTRCAISDSIKLKKYPVYISFLKPLQPSDYQTMTCDEVKNYCFNAIQEEVNRLREKFKTDIEKLKIKKRK